MILTGTGSQALVELFATEWQASRPERADIPQIVGDPDLIDASIADYEQNKGVLVTEDRQETYQHQAAHDLIHCYHPEGVPPDKTDKGFNEVGTVETVQVDIECGDRTINGQRSSARYRLVGDRRDSANQEYSGIAGEVLRILETVRRDYEEWEKVAVDPVALILNNSNARMSLNVELEIIGRNTVQ